jgi:hypothetical protein
MKSLGVWLQPVTHLLVTWLISTWGSALVLIGTLALAGSAAAYMSSASNHDARVGGSVLGSVAPASARSLCTPQGVFDGYDMTGELHPSSPGHCALLW